MMDTEGLPVFLLHIIWLILTHLISVYSEPMVTVLGHIIASVCDWYEACKHLLHFRGMKHMLDFLFQGLQNCWAPENREEH